MSEKVFYKKRLIPDESGLIVVTEKLFSIHETDCFYFCIPEFWKKILAVRNFIGETKIAYARRKKILRRISKSGSRIAFETETQALDHLRMLKRRQVEHLRREEAFIEKFLTADKLEKHLDWSVVPDSAELVRLYLRFD